MKATLSAICCLILVSIIGVNLFFNLAQDTQPTRTVPLEQALTREIPGWNVEDVPLGETEARLERVDATLNFDEYIQWRYQKGAKEFDLYVAYWKPGKMPVKEVHTHTPDICWVRNGWKIKDKSYDVAMHDSQGRVLLPAQGRVFEINEVKTYVNYWHVVGDDIYVNKRHKSGSLGFNSLNSLLKYGINTKLEQYFVRVSSARPIAELWNEPGFKELLDELGSLCLVPGSS